MTTRFWTLTAVLLSLSAPAAFAQANFVPPAMRMSMPETISVSGHAEVKAKPDAAYMSLSVTTQARAQSDAAKDNAVRTTALLAALKKAGVDAKDIQTQGYSVQPQYDYNPSPPVLTGFQAVNSVQITVHDLSRVGPLLDTAVNAGATQAGDISFDLMDRNAVQNEALAKAVAQARAHADVLAAAADVSVGRPVSISEGSAPVVQPLMMARSAMMAKDAAPVTPIAAQQITVSADVSIVYAIAAK